ncbi:MAG: peptidoglycan DD-metalloendopeptidase family protein [Bacteroidota bacterium]
MLSRDYRVICAVSLLIICGVIITTQDSNAQPVKNDRSVVYVRDTVYIRDTIWIKDGIHYSYNPEATSKTSKTIKRASKPVDAVSDFQFRELVDSLYTFGIDFDRDSLAEIIIQKDPTFSLDWNTATAHNVIELKQLPELIKFELLRGNEQYKYSWYGEMTWGFGPRWGRMHKGLDTNLETGDTLYAAFNGIVRYADYNSGGYGNCVVIRHFNGLETIYAHMIALDVEPGDLIFAGEVIGLGGNSGKSHGPHLHFETRYKSNSFDPLLLLDKNNQMALLSHEFYLEKSKLYVDGESDHLISSKSRKGVGKSHTVKKGETLYSIARKYKTSVEKLVKLNRLKNRNALQAGQKIRVR